MFKKKIELRGEQKHQQIQNRFFNGSGSFSRVGSGYFSGWDFDPDTDLVFCSVGSGSGRYQHGFETLVNCMFLFRIIKKWGKLSQKYRDLDFIVVKLTALAQIVPPRFFWFMVAHLRTSCLFRAFVQIDSRFEIIFKLFSLPRI